MTTKQITLTTEDLNTIATCLFLAGNTSKQRNPLLYLTIAQCKERYDTAVANGTRT